MILKWQTQNLNSREAEVYLSPEETGGCHCLLFYCCGFTFKIFIISIFPTPPHHSPKVPLSFQMYLCILPQEDLEH